MVEQQGNELKIIKIKLFWDITVSANMFLRNVDTLS